MIPETPERIYSLIHGKYEIASNGKVLELINPANESIVTMLQEADEHEVQKAVASAKAVFETGIWSRATIGERQAVLHRICDLVRGHAEQLAAMDACCVGLSFQHSLLPQAHVAADWFRYFASFIETQQNELYQQIAGVKTLVTREPIGVVALFSPWNIPVMSAALKLSAAIAFGNSCVIKPSEQSPWGTIKLVELMHEAGLPDGVVNIVNGRGAVTGAALSSHPDVAAISFTGGGQAGSVIAATASRRFAKVTMELGGKSANIIFDDADMERALDSALLSIFSNNGQACLAGSRILLQKNIAGAFINKFVERSRNIIIGDPFDKRTELGPQSSKAQMDRVLSFAHCLKEADGEILTGGKRAAGFDKGYYVEPTVVLAKDNQAPVCQEEIFGPFASVLTFDTQEQAIAIANDTVFGLAAYVWSQDLSRALQVSNGLRSGYIVINNTMQREKNAPFGGLGQSGLDREGGKHSMHFFTEAKTTVLSFEKARINKLGENHN